MPKTNLDKEIKQLDIEFEVDAEMIGLVPEDPKVTHLALSTLAVLSDMIK